MWSFIPSVVAAPGPLINVEEQRMQGCIDLLLELPGGSVIVDHKSTLGQHEHLPGYVPGRIFCRGPLLSDAIDPHLTVVYHSRRL